MVSQSLTVIASYTICRSANPPFTGTPIQQSLD